MFIIIVIPQTLKAGHQSSELRPVPWLDVPAPLHHLHQVSRYSLDLQTLMTAANGSGFTLNSGMLYGGALSPPPHLKMSASHALCGYPLVKMELDIQTRFLPRLPFFQDTIISDNTFGLNIWFSFTFPYPSISPPCFCWCGKTSQGEREWHTSLSQA